MDVMMHLQAGASFLCFPISELFTWTNLVVLYYNIKMGVL